MAHIVQEKLAQKGELAIKNTFLHLNSNCCAEEALLSRLTSYFLKYLRSRIRLDIS